MATMQQHAPYANGLGFRLRQKEEEQEVDLGGEEEEMVSFVGKGGESNHLTKNGKPDRRFKGQRDLPDEEVINPGYRRATSGQVVAGVHVTKDGSPDRRFKENRSITDEEAEIRKAELILAKYAGKTGANRH